MVAPRNLWVKSDDLNIEVGLEEGFRVEMAQEPLVFGEMRLLRGHLEVMGRRFEFDDASRVTFTGPPTAPRLNVLALHRNDREDVEVTVRVSDSGSSLRPPGDRTDVT